METTNTKRYRILKSVAAVMIAMAIALTGTLAWQAVSQTALNEVEATLNPGGRLHDDFNGENKDVYVENFTDPNTGTAVFARVRVDEYMEIGVGAGLKLGDAGYENKKAIPVAGMEANADINDVSTWKTYIPGATTGAQAYWNWQTGGSTVFMPTFNKNKDSLQADINGTYDGTDPDDDVHYDDYKSYIVGETKLGDEVYDADTNDTDEGASAKENINIKTIKDVEHKARETQTSQVMTMAEWLALPAEQQIGPYWVWDEDGWAYWAQPIEPGEATGLLLDGIELKSTLSDSWYYGINVVGQFVTADDIGKEDNTGFYDTTKGTIPTLNAETLLAKITGADEMSTALDKTTGDAIRIITPGDTDTVTIDGIEFYVLAKKPDKVLLMAKDIQEERAFDAGTPRWQESALRAYLNGEWLDNHTTLKEAAIETTLMTRRAYDGLEFDTTTDKVFLLSEADLYGTQNDLTAQAQDYTYGAMLTPPKGSWEASYGGTAGCYWLRSPYYSAAGVADVNADGTCDVGSHDYASVGVRPVLWISLV